MPPKMEKLNRSHRTPKRNIEPLGSMPISNSLFKIPLRWQVRADHQIYAERWSLICAPPGSGKTTLQLLLAVKRVIASGFKHKIVIAAPKKMIGQGFVRNGDQLPGLNIAGKEIDIQVNHDLTGDIVVGKKDALKDFLTTPVAASWKKMYERTGTISGCICVTTHAALALASAQWFSEIPTEGIAEMAADTTFIIDEAHHVSGVFGVFDGHVNIPTGSAEQDLTQNRLGAFVHFLVNKAPQSTCLVLASATPFRADKRPVITPELRKRFGKGLFSLPFTEHLKIVGIEKIDLNYALFDESPVDEILARVKAEPQECHLICVPNASRSWRRIPGEMDRLLAGVKALYGEDVVLNLMPEDSANREENRKALLMETKDDRDSIKLRVVIYVALVNEGVDWPSCSRFHNASFGASLPNEEQKIGRLLRRFPGKDHVIATAHIPNFITKDDEEEYGKNAVGLINNALLLGMQYDDMCLPIFLPDVVVSTLRQANQVIDGVPDSEAGAAAKNEEDEIYRPTIEALFGGRMHEVDQELIRRIEPLKVKDETTVGPVIEDILKEFKIPAELRAAATTALEIKVYRNLSANKPKIEYINVDLLSGIDFDRLVYSEGLHLASMFTCEVDEKVLAEFRTRLNASLCKIEEARQAAYQAKFIAGHSSKRERLNKTREVRTRLTQKVGRGGSVGTEQRILNELYPKQREKER